MKPNKSILSRAAYIVPFLLLSFCDNKTIQHGHHNEQRGIHDEFIKINWTNASGYMDRCKKGKLSKNQFYKTQTCTCEYYRDILNRKLLQNEHMGLTQNPCEGKNKNKCLEHTFNQTTKSFMLTKAGLIESIKSDIFHRYCQEDSSNTILSSQCKKGKLLIYCVTMIENKSN